MHYRMYSIRAVKLNTRHEMICLQSSLLFTLASLNHNFKLLTNYFVKFTFQVHKLTKLDKKSMFNQNCMREGNLQWNWIYWLLIMDCVSRNWRNDSLTTFLCIELQDTKSHKTYVYTCNNMRICTFLHTRVKC